jgi:hypothetical protein
MNCSAAKPRRSQTWLHWFALNARRARRAKSSGRRSEQICLSADAWEKSFQGGGSIPEIEKPFPPSVNYGNTVSRAIPGGVFGLDWPSQRAVACQYSFKTPGANAHTKSTIN